MTPFVLRKRKELIKILSLPEDSSKRRDRLLIMAEILEVAIDGALKTQLMYRANLSFAQLNEYIRILSDLGLLGMSNNSQRTVYRTTPKGMRYLQSYREIKDLMKKDRHSDPNGNNGSGVFLVKRGSNVICTKGPL